VQLQILYVQPVAPPEHLVGVGHLHIFDLDVMHLAEHLGSVDPRIGHFQVVGIPQGGTGADIEEASVDGEAVDVPERIIPFEPAIDGFDVAALFNGRLSGADGYVLQPEIVRFEQGALASEFRIRNKFHRLSCYSFLIDLMSRAGIPPTTVFAATSFVTTAPAATTALSPTVTPERIVAFDPTQTFFPKTIGAG